MVSFLMVSALVALLVGCCLAQPPADAEAAELAPTIVIPLPSDPESVCTRDAMLRVTEQHHSCAEAFHHGEDPDEACCIGLAEAYGPNSTAPTANCFCHQPYWETLEALSELNYIGWSGAFGICKGLGYEIYYYDSEAEMCSGAVPPEPEPAEEEVAKEEEEIPVLSMRSYSTWMNDLDKDVWGSLSFTAGVISVLGFGIMAWTFVFDFYHDMVVRYKWGKGA